MSAEAVPGELGPAEPYDEAFFAQQSDGSLRSARLILAEVLRLLEVRSLLDVGCGVGTWMRAALDLGVPEVLGVDGEYVDQTALRVEARHFFPADLASARIAEALPPAAPERFDLVICMEVAEHLPHERAAALVRQLTGFGDAVLFSAAVPFQFGAQHVNEQWPEFWAMLFREQGFACFDCLREPFWADPAVEWWYAQNAFLFARAGSALAGRLPRPADPAGLSRVHPKNLLANLLGLPRRYRQQAAAEEFVDFVALQSAYAGGGTTPPPSTAIARARAAPAAPDVFPRTRTEIYEPEQEIAALAQRLAETGEYLRSAEHHYGEARRDIEAHIGARLRAEARLGEAQGRIDRQFRQTDALRADLASLLAENRHGEAERQRLAQEGAVLTVQIDRLAQEIERLRQPTLETRLGQRLVALAARVPRPLRRAARLGLRSLRRLRSLGRRSPALEPAPAPALAAAEPACIAPDFIEPPPAPPAPVLEPAAPLRKWGEACGSVSQPTLRRGIARLRRFELFNEADYLARNEDVKAAGFDPHAHFLQSGAFEDRGRTDPEELARAMSGLIPAAAVATGQDFADLPELVERIGHVGILVSSFGNLFMAEIADDLASDLQSVGMRVSLLDETGSPDDRPPFCIFVAPHEFFTLGSGPGWVREDVLANGFMFGTEQVQTKWFNLALPFMLMSRGVLDICAQTAAILERAGMPALHVLPGCRKRPAGLMGTDYEHPLYRVLPASAKPSPEPARSMAGRPIDVSFFGNASPRRNRFFARNAAFFADYESFLYCRNADRGPLTGRGQEAALTRLAAHVCGHSKITLNIHRDDLGFFEWHRMVRLGMGSGSVVVSDPCLPHPDFIAGEHYFQEQARHIPDLLEWLLRTAEGDRAAEKIRANVDDLIGNVFDTRRTMAGMLRFIAQHAKAG